VKRREVCFISDFWFTPAYTFHISKSVILNLLGMAMVINILNIKVMIMLLHNIPLGTF